MLNHVSGEWGNKCAMWPVQDNWGGAERLQIVEAIFHLWRRMPPPLSRSPTHSDAVSCLLLLSQQGPITILVCLSRLLLLWSFPLNGVFSNDSTLQKMGRGVVQQLIQAATSSRTAGALECLSGAE